MRICKKCGQEREREYLCLNAQGRAVYKDEAGKIWQGKVCGTCFAGYVKSKANKEPLGDKACEQCGLIFKKKAHKQKVCSARCYAELQSLSQ